ncbi:hypothetical protein [Streptomyces flavidovirens]
MTRIVLTRSADVIGSSVDVVRLHRLVRHLVADGDRRAAGHRARRTLGEMAPGYTRPPLLAFAQPLKAGNDACPLCGYWRCRCGESVAPAATGASVMAVAQ